MAGANKRQKLSDKGHEDAEDKQPPISSAYGVLNGYYSSGESDNDQEDQVQEEASERQAPQANQQKDEPSPKEDSPVSLQLSQSQTQFEILDEENESNHEDESSDEENAIDLNDLDSSSESDSESNVSPIQAFKNLLSESSIDYYGSWEIESLKLINDEAFFKVASNKERKRLFDEWCAEKIKCKNDEHDELIANNEFSAESEFVKFMRFLECFTNKDRLFIDFKKKHGDELSRFELPSREMEKAYKELMVFLPRPLDFRIGVFQKVILKMKVFQRNTREALKDPGIVAFIREKNALLQKESSALNYELLHDIETKINLAESLQHSVKYYIVDVEMRIKLMVGESLLLI